MVTGSSESPSTNGVRCQVCLVLMASWWLKADDTGQGQGLGEKFPVRKMFSELLWATGNNFLKGRRCKPDGMIKYGERMKERKDRGEDTK